MIKCLGCGIKLQNINASKVGYTPKKEAVYCERCFKIKHYNNALSATIDKEKDEILDNIKKTNHHVLFIIDILNINSETIKTFNLIENPKTLVISKLDLMPKNIKLNRVTEVIREVYNIDSKILFISSFKKTNLNKLYNYLVNNKYHTNYVVGYINSGKSTLINTLYEYYQNEKSTITTSLVPNTTLDFINMKISSDLILIDSPGFVMENNLLNNLEIIKKVNPHKHIKPLVLQVKQNSGVIIEGNIKIFNETKNKVSWIFYMSNLLKIDKIFDFNDINNLNYKVKANSDLIIKGFGFINIKNDCEIKITNLDANLIEIRKSIF